MSSAKHPEQLFSAARGLPAELSLTEVESLFTSPPPPPPSRLWWQGGHLKFFLMFTALLTAVLLVVGGQPHTPPSLSGFPLSEHRSITALPLAPPVKTVALPSGAIAKSVSVSETKASGAFPSLASLTPPAPAPAPQKVMTPAPQNDPLPLPVAAVLPPTEPLAGKFAFRDGQLQLYLTDDQLLIGNNWRIPLPLDEEETAALKRPDGPFGVITRPTGKLLLDGRRKGTFEFLPNSRFRQQLNDAGCGDAALGEEKLTQTGFAHLLFPEAPPQPPRPRETLWLKYFATNVDEDYLALLEANDYGEEELGSLWHLADHQLSYDQLKRLLAVVPQLFEERLTISQLVKLKHHIGQLEVYLASGVKRVSYAKITESVFPFPPLNLPEAPIMMNLDSLFTPFDLNTDVPQDWGLATEGHTSDTLKACCRMDIRTKGNFRIWVVDGVRKYVVAYSNPAALAALKTKISDEKMRFRNPMKGETIDLEISRNSLRGMRFKGRTQLYGSQLGVLNWITKPPVPPAPPATKQ